MSGLRTWSPQRWAIVEFLRSTDGRFCDITTIAEATGLRRENVRSLVGRLEALGVVVSQPGLRHSRRYQLR